MRQKPNLKLRRIGDKYLIVDLSAESVNLAYVFSFNETAAAIWQAFYGRNFTQAQIVDWLSEEYYVTKELAEYDTSQLIKSWRDGHLILE